MSTLILLWQRFSSENPKFFTAVQIVALIVGSVSFVILRLDSAQDILWVTDGVRSVLNDIVVSCVSILGTSQLTTNNKELSEK